MADLNANHREGCVCLVCKEREKFSETLQSIVALPAAVSMPSITMGTSVGKTICTDCTKSQPIKESNVCSNCGDEDCTAEPWEDLDDWQRTIMEQWAEVSSQLNIQTKVCEVEWCSTEDDHIIIDGEEWLVLEDDEATERAEEKIKEKLWLFSVSWLANQTGFPEKVFDVLQEDGESSQENIETLIEATCSLDCFVADTISSDGRGAYLSSYDNEELEIRVDGTYQYFYRLD